MRKKKAFYLVFAALLASGSVLAGCSQNTKTNTANNGNSGAEGSSSFSYLMHDKFINWLKEDKWYPHVETATGTTVEFVPGGSNDDEYYASVDQKIISRTFPDSGIVSVSQATVYGAQGAFVDLAPYIEEFGPNIKSYIEKNPSYKTLITDKDGQIFGLVAEAPRFADFIFYRADHFEKAGITEAPQTIDQLTDAMRKLKAYYGKEDKITIRWSAVKAISASRARSMQPRITMTAYPEGCTATAKQALTCIPTDTRKWWSGIKPFTAKA